ncbi:MAG: hypothetical protein KF841_12630 [Phycisphaerae bacterium]|nr:hypothetical protein [Phycisphaerae bacterium]
MANDQSVNVLNRLLLAEYESVISRLEQVDPYVSMLTADDRSQISRLLRDAQQHRRELSEMILNLRGAPIPPRYSTVTGGMHYVRLSHLMPEVLADLRRLISVYESAAGTSGNRDADALISTIQQNYRRNLSALEKLQGLQPAKAS